MVCLYISTMYRIALFIILSCIVSACCVQELVGQPSEGRQGRGPRGQRTVDPPPAPPAAEQPSEQPTEGEAPAVAAEESAETEFVPPPPPPANSLVQIIHPTRADRLGLTESQRSEANRIVNVQTLELSNAQAQKAPPERFLEIYKQTEEKLSNLLTATQQALMAQGFETKEFVLVFNRQPWKDVLQFIADQGGYNLIMDAPPPGTFSYADRERHTITEVLDRVNGILITNGYTLVRKDRILMLLDLRKPVPNRYFPSIQPEELAGRASNEYVSVQFNLERRNRENVLQGIEPIKSNSLYTRVYPLGGNNLLVIADVETLNAIQRVINSVENPPAPKREEPKPPTPPIWKTYTIEKNDPDTIESIFKEHISDAKMLRLPGSQQIHVFARPDQHAQFETVLKMLEEDRGAGLADAKLVSYSLVQYFDPQGLPLNLRGALGGQGRGEFGGFGMRNFDPSMIPQGVDPVLFYQMRGNPMFRFGMEIINTLKNAYPKARISDTPVAERIVVLASESDQESINDFFESLRPAEENRQTAKLYQFAEKGKKMNAETERQIQALLPNARTTLDTDLGQILVIATVKEHAELTKMVQELEAATPTTGDRVLQSYQLSASTINMFWSLVAQLAAQNHLRGYIPIRDTQRNQYLIWASEKQHARIAEVYREVTGQSEQADGGTPDVVVPFTPKNIALDTLQTVIQDVYPTATMVLNAQRKQIIIRIRPNQKEALQSLLEQLDAADPDEERRYFDAYPIEAGFYSITRGYVSGRPQLMIEELVKIAPGARINWDTPSQKLIVWGTTEEHAKIKEAIRLLIGDQGGEKTFRTFPLRRVEWGSIAGILRRIYPEPVVEYTHDASTKQLIVQGHPKMLDKVAELLEILDPEEPAENAPYVRFYQFEKEPTSTIISALQRLAPSATIVPDRNSNQLMVIARPAEQEIIKKNVEFIAASFAEPAREVKRFDLNRMHYTDVMRVIDRTYPSARVTFDNAGQSIIVEAYPEVMPKIIALVETLDPQEPTDGDFVIKFYSLKQELTPLVLAGLRRLAPYPSMIIPDKKQIMVVAKPYIQKVVEENTQFILETMTPVEEPILGIYTVTREERNRLTSFITEIAVSDLRDALIFPGGNDVTTAASADQMLIWARPTEHDLIATVLKQFQESQAATPERQFKSFPMSVGDLETAQSILRATHPDAMLFPDSTGNRLMVLATAEDMERVTRTLRIQGSIDDRAMVAYPVAGVPPETIRTVIMDVYQGLKINVDEVSRKIFIWASPEEHVRIGEIIEQANKEIDPESELSEKFAAYSAANLDTAMVVRLFETMIPAAHVYAQPGEDKIVVRAIARDHQQINELFEKLREKDERFRPRLMVYPFGDVDPVMVEAMLRNQLPEAQSMSPDDLVERVSFTYWMERYYSVSPYYRQYAMYSQEKKDGYYKVDPQTQSVYVFVSGDLQKTVGEAMEQLVVAGNQEGLKPVLRRYGIEEIRSFWQISDLLYRIAPSAVFQPIWTYTLTPQGYYTSSSTEFLAYTNEAQQEKIEAFIRELNDKSGVGGKRLLAVTLPENSPFSRDKIIATLRNVFTDLAPMQGGAANQIVFWATPHRLEQIQKMVNEVCQPLPEGERTIAKTYPLRHISMEEAVTWLSALHPNASFDPEKLTAIEATVQPPTVRPSQRTDEAKIIVAVATPLEHVEIAKTIQELDKELPDALKMVPREYALDDMPAGAFYPFYSSLNQVFPQAVVTPSPLGMSVMVVAIEDDHKKIAEFVQTYRDDNERKRPRMEVYTLQWLNYYQVAQMIRNIAPSAGISAGSRPEQIAVWGTLKEQTDIAEALATMETAAEVTDVSTQKLKVYKTGMGKAYDAAAWLRWQFPGTLTFAINPNEILAWASPVIHEAMESMLESVAEVFPDPIMHPYFFKHVSLSEGHTILQQAFAGQVISMTPRPTTQDLMVFAAPDVHEKIAASIALFDIQKPADMETSLKFYDMSTLPAEMFSPLALQLTLAVQNRAQVLPGIVPGQMAVWARPDDHDTINGLVEQILAGGLVPQSQTFDLSDLSPGGFSHVMSQIPAALGNRVIVMHGAAPGQLVFWGKPADLERVETLVKQMLDEHPGITATTETYTLYRGNARDVDAMLRQVTPHAYIGYGTTQNQMIVRAKESDHVKIKEIFDRVNESDADVTLKPYFFKHLSLQEAVSVLSQVFSNSASIIPRYETGELLVFAASDVHQKIADCIANFDIQRPEGTKHIAKIYDLSDLPVGWFNFAVGHIPGAVGPYVYAFPGVASGQLVVWAKPSAHEEVNTIVEQLRSDCLDTALEMEIYSVRRGGTAVSTIIYSLIPQMTPNVRVYPGTSANQIVVMAKAADHVKVKEAIDKLNQSDPDISLRTYWTGTQRASTAISYLTQQFPGMLVYSASPSEVMAWATPDEHETIASLMKTFAEAFPDPVLKPYYFKHVSLVDGYTTLYYAFYNTVASMSLRQSTGDVLVYASPGVHEKIAASIAEFDVQRPEGTEALPKTYDLSDLTATAFWQAVSNIPVAMGGRVQVLQGYAPGQIIVWGKPADHEKVTMMVDQILAERPDTTATLEVYALRRGTVTNVGSLLMSMFPNIQAPRQGTSPNQMLIWAKASDHRKIDDVINRLNESDPDMSVETYSLKNVDWYSANNILNIMIAREGLDIQLYPDSMYSKRLVVLAKPEEQQRVAEVLENFRLEERTVESYPLAYTDPFAARTAISVLFYDEPLATSPWLSVEPNTNMFFVEGTKEQLAKVRKLLRDMGENISEPAQPTEHQPHVSVPAPVQQPGTIRVLQLRGSGTTEDILRELDKRWKQSQPNQLRIINTEETTPSQFSMEDEIQRENMPTTPRAEDAGQAASSLEDLLPSIPPVYVVANEDGSLTITSADTVALDQLEVLLNRINSGIVFEGRDYTIYSVRNISAAVVNQRLQIVLRDKIQRGLMQQPGAAGTVGLPLQITVDIAANTIMVRGSRVDRQEAANLIALFDVSELPGERIVQKPITVPIENTEANRVYNEVMKVYGTKMRMTQLPGGMTPQIIVNATTNSLEVFAPEPLATELAEYIKEVDAKAQEEPGRKLHVIQTGVKASVIQQAILQMERQMRMQMQPYPYPSPYAYPGGMRWGY